MQKYVHELTIDDLNTFPVWECVLDEEGNQEGDETTVRSCDIGEPFDLSDRDLIVRAIFTLADGTQMRGYLAQASQSDNSVSTLQPVIVTERGQVVFWYGVLMPEPSDVAESYERLSRTADSVFPIQVTSDVDLLSNPVSITIPSFMTLVYETGAIIETK